MFMLYRWHKNGFFVRRNESKLDTWIDFESAFFANQKTSSNFQTYLLSAANMVLVSFLAHLFSGSVNAIAAIVKLLSHAVREPLNVYKKYLGWFHLGEC